MCWRGCRETETFVYCWWECKEYRKQYGDSIKIKDR